MVIDVELDVVVMFVCDAQDEEDATGEAGVGAPGVSSEVVVHRPWGVVGFVQVKVVTSAKQESHMTVLRYDQQQSPSVFHPVLLKNLAKLCDERECWRIQRSTPQAYPGRTVGFCRSKRLRRQILECSTVSHILLSG